MKCPVCLSEPSRFFLRVDQRDYWRCPQCQATFLDPAQLPSRSAERAVYELHQNDVDDEGYRQFLSRAATPLLERLSGASEGLDYGCGPGPALADMLTSAGHTVTLYDPQFAPDESALQRQYDFITCTEVAEHFHRPAQEFARLNRLLRPNGWLVVMTRLQTDDAAFADWHYRRDPTHVVFYRSATLQWLSRMYGWECEVMPPEVVLMHKLDVTRSPGA